jgi:hypothetical protein
MMKTSSRGLHCSWSIACGAGVPLLLIERESRSSLLVKTISRVIKFI